MKTEKEIKARIGELRETQMKNVKSRDWKWVIITGEQLEALKWVLED